MTDPNGTTRRRKGDAARRIMAELGPACTFAEVTSRLQAAGAPEISDQTFYAIKREQFPRNGVPMTQTIPDRPPPAPDAPPARDWLTRLVKFGVAVEDVGGIAAARRMLDALEQLQKTVAD